MTQPEKKTSRRQAVKILGGTSLGLAAAPFLPALAHAMAQRRARGNPPNILFIFTDDHAAHAISAYGSKINQTPNIDRIAREGALFENCFCTNSICAPSRAVVLTGKHSHINGQIDNKRSFDGSQPTLPKMLRKAGYETALIGKWHLKSDPTGFDHWQVLPGQGSYYNPIFLTPEGRRQYPGYATDVTTDLALDWIRKERDPAKPFLLMCQHKAPHRNWLSGPDHLSLYQDVEIPEPDTLFDDYSGRSSAAKKQEMSIAHHMYDSYDLKLPLSEETSKQEMGYWKNTTGRMNEQQRKDWEASYKAENEAFAKNPPTGKDRVRWNYQRYMKAYLRCIASVDDNIGRMLDYLDESGLAKDTIVIYSSDQGFFLGDHGWYDKRWMYEESLRMPLVMRWPGVIPPETRISALAQNLDFAPTFLAMAGEKTPDAMQGVSLVPLVKGKTPKNWRKSIYYHYHERGEHAVAPHYGVRTERYKLIHFYTNGEWELFDLKEDPKELKSVYNDPAYVETVAALKAELERLRKLYRDSYGKEE